MENKQEPVTQTEEKIEETVTQTDNKIEDRATEKTFTQEELNAIVKKETDKATKKYKDVDLKAYKEWQESQKTEAEKQSELNQKMTDTQNENLSLKQENQVLKSGVNADDVDYVVFKVSKMEGEFEDNLKEFLKQNPKYLQTNDTTPVQKENITDGVSVNKNSVNNSDDGVTAILKAKHPEAFD